MARNVIIAIGAISWTFLIGRLIAFYAAGEWMPPTITILVGVAWVTMRVARPRMIRRQSTEAA